MSASIFGAAYDRLPVEVQVRIRRQLATRKHLYLQALRRVYSADTRAVIIGDTPGPQRPQGPGHHYTPFYSTKNCSLWLNKLLVEAGVDETKLLWFNAKLADGSELPGHHLTDLLRLNPVPLVIALGGNAEAWVRRSAPESPYIKVFHPQYAKRFRSKEPYGLIDTLKNL